MPTKEIPTRQELQILKIVWDLEEATVRDVYERMRERGSRTAYTTVMTLMSIMTEKRHLERNRQGRAYVYRPAAGRSQVLRAIVNDLLGRVFDGSAEPLMVHLIQEEDLSAEELETLWNEANSDDH